MPRSASLRRAELQPTPVPSAFSERVEATRGFVKREGLTILPDVHHKPRDP